MNKLPGEKVAVTPRYASKANRPGGISRDEAVSAANVAIDELRPGLVLKIDSALETLIDALETAATHGGWTEVPLAGTRRAADMVRDMGATAGLDVLAAIAHPLGDLLDAVAFEGLELSANDLKCFTDALRFAGAEQHRSLTKAECAELIDGLNALCDLRLDCLPKTQQDDPDSGSAA